MPKKTIKDKVLLALTELNKKVVPLDVTQYLREKEVSFSETKKVLRGHVCDTLWHLWKDGCIKKDEKNVCYIEKVTLTPVFS